MEEVNLQCEAFEEIPDANRNEFISLHTKPNGTINFFNLLAAHYNYFNDEQIKIDAFKIVNKGRFVTIDDGTLSVNEFIYQFDSNGLLINSTRK